MGGDHPFRLSGGHGRWSNHAMNMTNSVMLETHRGKPFVLINDATARVALSTSQVSLEGASRKYPSVTRVPATAAAMTKPLAEFLRASQQNEPTYAAIPASMMLRRHNRLRSKSW